MSSDEAFGSAQTTVDVTGRSRWSSFFSHARKFFVFTVDVCQRFALHTVLFVIPPEQRPAPVRLLPRLLSRIVFYLL